VTAESSGKRGGALRTSLLTWPRALPYLKPFKSLVVLSLLLMMFGAVAGLAEPWPVALMVDSVLGDKPLPGPLENLVADGIVFRIALAAGLGLLLSVAINGVALFNQYVNTKLEMRMVLEFRSELFRHVQRLSFAFHDQRRTGEFMGRINGQASSVGSVTVAAFPLVQNALMLVGMLYIAYLLNPPIALLATAVIPAIYYSTGLYGSRIGPQVRKVKGMEIRSLHIVHEAVSMLRVIVAFNRERYEYDKFRAQGEKAVEARIKLTVKQMLFSLAVNLVTACGTAGVLAVGAWQVTQGELSIGQLLVLLSYIAAAYKPLEIISTTINGIQEHLIGFEMALELLESAPDIVEKPDAREVGRVRGDIAFEGVNFAYEGRERALADISFVAPAGGSLAIVGPTGAGKSTLVSLIPRFYDPATGRVMIDGHDLRDLTLESLRAQMSIVLQEPLLFTDSIANNIRYGRLDATQKEVEAAAKAANAHDFVMRLPRKYQTKLGERGAMLSGGERQRIAVARAFLKDAPILILDEPTSSIDSRTEGVIMEALERLMRGRTTVLIAHRLSTIRLATRILVLDEGRVEELGSHEELLARDGLYGQLWRLQNGEGTFEPRRKPAASRASA
jgi:ABC-type multidrug transport system fused ATPase/permease subunit